MIQLSIFLGDCVSNEFKEKNMSWEYLAIIVLFIAAAVLVL